MLLEYVVYVLKLGDSRLRNSTNSLKGFCVDDRSATRPLVTILMAAYNAATFIDRSIASALSQSNINVEVLVVDDASVDGTADHVSQAYRDDPRVKVIRQPINAGPAAARNVGIAEASGEWIAVLDADDALAPESIAALVDLGTRTKADIVAGNFRFYKASTCTLEHPALRISEEPQTLDRHTFVAKARPYKQETDLGLLKPMFRASFLRSAGVLYPGQIRHGEDFEFVLMLLIRGAKYVMLSSLIAYFYTTRESGMSRTPVNYEGMVKRTRYIAGMMEIAKDSRMRRLLIERAAALERLDFSQKDNVENHNFYRMFKAMLSIGGRRWLAGRLKVKLRG